MTGRPPTLRLPPTLLGRPQQLQPPKTIREQIKASGRPVSNSMSMPQAGWDALDTMVRRFGYSGRGAMVWALMNGQTDAQAFLDTVVRLYGISFIDEVLAAASQPEPALPETEGA